MANDSETTLVERFLTEFPTIISGFTLSFRHACNTDKDCDLALQFVGHKQPNSGAMAHLLCCKL